MVYGSSLENWRGLIPTVGSNPTLSAALVYQGWQAKHGVIGNDSGNVGSCGFMWPYVGLPLLSRSGGSIVLPPFVHDYLRDGAPEGGRNEAIFKVAQQFLWCGLTESEAVSQGGSSVVREVERAIASAFKSAPREPLPACCRSIIRWRLAKCPGL